LVVYVMRLKPQKTKEGPTNSTMIEKKKRDMLPITKKKKE